MWLVLVDMWLVLGLYCLVGRLLGPGGSCRVPLGPGSMYNWVLAACITNDMHIVMHNVMYNVMHNVMHIVMHNVMHSVMHSVMPMSMTERRFPHALLVQ